MNHPRVNQILRDDPDVPRVIALTDGRRYRVRGMETWLAGPLGFILLTPKGLAAQGICSADSRPELRTHETMDRDKTAIEHVRRTIKNGRMTPLTQARESSYSMPAPDVPTP